MPEQLTKAIEPVRDERGFTLIEMLVVLLAGVVVVSTLFTIIDVTLHQTTRTFSRVDATQRARPALETIENELHSACVAPGVKPVRAGSTDSSIIFWSGYGSMPTITPVQHTITLNSGAGTLTDTRATNPTGGPPDWSFTSSPSTTTTLLTNVAPSPGKPVFQYFAYKTPTDAAGTPYTDANGNQYMMLIDGTTAVPGTSTIPAASPMTAPLTSNDAAEVVITLVVKPAGGSNERTDLAPNTVSDSVVLRVSAAADHVGAGDEFSPCGNQGP